MKTALLLDMNNIISRIYFSLNYKKENITKEDLNKTIRTILDSITNLINFNKLNKADVYCIFDTKDKSWRTNDADDYKSDRKSDKFLGKVIEYFVEHSQKTFGYNSLQIANIEADDIIAYISIYDKTKDFIIVSNDKDMEQLLLEYNVKIFDSKQGKFKELNPVESLVHKIVLGDKSDTIKSILNNITPSIQYGKTKIEALFEEKFDIGQSVSSMCTYAIEDILSRFENKKLPEDTINEIKVKLLENIKNNENLISFYKIPSAILSTISLHYKEVEFKKLSDFILNDNTFSKNIERDV